MKSINEFLVKEEKSMIQLSDAIDKLSELGNKSIPAKRDRDDKQYTADELANDLRVVVDLCGNIDIDDLTAIKVKNYLIDDLTDIKVKNYLKTLFK